MSPETYYKILLIILARNSTVVAFSLADFFANGGKQILINTAAQYGGYIAATAVGNNITPSILIPILANSKLATDFLQVSHSMPGQPERVATIAVLFSAAGLITKTGDIPTNASMGAVIAAFADYMSSVVNNGNVPFAYIRAKRMNLTFKQHMRMEMLLTVGLIIFSGTTWCVVYILRKTFERGSKLKRPRNVVKKISTIKARLRIQKMKIFKSKPKVEFIPIH